MSFNKVLELLHNSGEVSTNFDDFSKFKPQIIETVSGNIADLIYNSFNDKSTQKRLDVIEFLRTICCENAGHFKVDENNCGPILTTFFQEFITDDTQLQLFYNDARKERNLNKPPTSVAQIINYYQIKSQRELELKSKRDGYKLEMEKRFPKNFKFNFNTTVEKTNNYAQIRNIFGEIEDVKLNLESNKHSRESRISLGYSLLNINEDKRFDDIIKRILNELCLYEQLHDFENDFLTHLFESTGQLKSQKDLRLFNSSNQIVEMLNLDILAKFPFIYEIPIIQLCTTLIPMNKEELNTKLTQILLEKVYGKIFSIIEYNAVFKCSIIDICSTLFVWSNFNNGILFLINYIAK